MKFEHRTISVRGVGKVSAKPDMVQIQVGVTAEAPTALQALAKNNEAMNRLFHSAPVGAAAWLEAAAIALAGSVLVAAQKRLWHRKAETAAVPASGSQT